MAFPTSPSNNQVHKEGNRAFVYDSALGTWDQVRETNSDSVSSLFHGTQNKMWSGEIDNEVTFPSGHVTNVFSFHITNGAEYTHFEDAHKVSQDSLGWSATSGRKYHIFSSMGHWPYITGNSRTGVWGDIKLYWGTTYRQQGTSSTDNQLAISRIGRIVQTSTTGLHHYIRSTLQGSFTAASSVPHYVYQTAISADGYCYFRSMATTQADWNVIIFETMP